MGNAYSASARPFEAVLLGLLVLLAASPHSAWAATTNMTNANHRIDLSSQANRAGDTYYVRGDRRSGTTLRVDYKNIANLQDYALVGANLYFFESGATTFGSRSHVVGRLRSGESSRESSRPERVVNLALDFSAACGKRGGLVAAIELKSKRDGSYVHISQGPRPVPFSGGVMPAVIDCDQPRLHQIADRSPSRFNHVCWDASPNRATDIAVEIQDAGGIQSVELISSQSALRVSPRRLQTGDLTPVSGRGDRYKATFSMTASNSAPLNNVKLTVRITDLANRTETSDFSVNLPGNGEDAVVVQLSPVKSPVFVGQRASYGGTVEPRSCALSGGGARLQWMIDKVASKTATHAQSSSAGGSFKLSGRRTPFIAPFTRSEAGFYRLRLVDISTNTTVYTAATAIEYLAVTTRPVGSKVLPAPGTGTVPFKNIGGTR